MAVQSIRTSVQEGDIARNHLFVPPLEMTIREVNGVGEFDNLAQKVRTRSEALDNAWDFLAA